MSIISLPRAFSTSLSAGFYTVLPRTFGRRFRRGTFNPNCFSLRIRKQTPRDILRLFLRAGFSHLQYPMSLTWLETSPAYHLAETPTLYLKAFETMFGVATYMVSRKSEPHKLAAVGSVRTLAEAQLECERLAEQLG